jgi:hypothetical protein
MYNKFEDWFLETVGYGSRDETFWEAVRYGKDEMAYYYVKTAWRLGYEAGRRTEGTYVSSEDSGQSG